MVWYHGSPRLFKALEIGHPSSSRIGPFKCVFLTSDPKIAVAAAGRFGWVYTVEVLPESAVTAEDYEVRRLEEMDEDRPDRPNSLRVYETSGLKIVCVHPVKEFKKSLTFS